MKSGTRSFLAVAIGALVFTIGGISAAECADGGITLGRPWSAATPNGAATAAAYMSIENHGRTDDRLLGGSSPLAGKVEVHEMSMAGGIMSMHALADGLAIPAGKTVKSRTAGELPSDAEWSQIAAEERDAIAAHAQFRQGRNGACGCTGAADRLAGACRCTNAGAYGSPLNGVFHERR